MGAPQRLIAALAASAALALGGCALSEKFTYHGHKATVVAPASAVAAWNNKVMFVPDPANNGHPTPGLAGRLYLFGPAGDFPLVGHGNVVVDLYDDTPRDGQPSTTHLEQWQFDPDTLHKLVKKDSVGMGYTLFLPWGSYRPDIRTVRLSLRYEAPGAMPLYAPSSPVTLEHVAPPTGTHSMPF